MGTLGNNNKHVQITHLDELVPLSVKQDLSVYAESQFESSSRFRLTSGEHQLLVDKSEYLFQWASTACRYI
jgi:hypothetical protein